MSQEEKINQLRKTLKARIIPNLPLTPEWVRKDVEKAIDDFEFEHYLAVSEVNQEEKKFIDNWIEWQYKVIETCKEKYPEQFLLVTWIYVEPIKKLLPVGLFKCMACNKPITHFQFNFSRVCESCDVGRKNPKWIVEKPKVIEK